MLTLSFVPMLCYRYYRYLKFVTSDPSYHILLKDGLYLDNMGTLVLCTSYCISSANSVSARSLPPSVLPLLEYMNTFLDCSYTVILFGCASFHTI